jgi:hypothetical protein
MINRDCEGKQGIDEEEMWVTVQAVCVYGNITQNPFNMCDECMSVKNKRQGT